MLDSFFSTLLVGSLSLAISIAALTGAYAVFKYFVLDKEEKK